MDAAAEMTDDDLQALRQLMESQSPRVLRRFLDYGKRLRSGVGLDQLSQWLGKILLDDGSVYDLSERSQAFEIAACEHISEMWERLESVEPEVITVGGPIDKMAIYRRLLDGRIDEARRAALLDLMRQRYRKTWSWLRDCSLANREIHRSRDGRGDDQLLQRFLQELDRIDPLEEGGVSSQQLNSLREVSRRQEESLKTLADELEVAEDRSERAHQRAKTFESESKQMRRQLREEKENGEKLRQERSRRIKVERETRDSMNELQRLRSEYIKLDERLREMARRAAAAEARRGSGMAASLRIDLSPLRSIAAAQLLGLGDPPTPDDLNRARRQFANALHSDRVNQLPGWVGELFDELMGIVNEICDRSAVRPGKKHPPQHQA